MDNSLARQILDNFRRLATDRLKELWESRHAGDLSGEGLEALRQVLVERRALTNVARTRVPEDSVVGHHVLLDGGGSDALELPSAHRVIQDIARFGDPARVAAEIEEEVNSETDLSLVGPVLLTPSWMLVGYESRCLSVFNYGELGWVFKEVVQHMSGIIPTYQDGLLVVNALSGASARLGMREEEITSVLGELAERAPWVLIGYNRTRKRYWQDRREQLVAEIGEHRDEVLKTWMGTPRCPGYLHILPKSGARQTPDIRITRGRPSGPLDDQGE